MKKSLIAILMMLLLLCGLTACSARRSDLKFYVLKKADVVDNMSDSALLAAAKSKGRLAFTGEDVRAWYWADHQVLLRELSVYGGAQEGGSRLFQAEAEDLFILALGNRILYIGGFASAGETLGEPQEIYIEDGYADNFAIACRREYDAAEDPRNVTALYNYLADHDLLTTEEEKE